MSELSERVAREHFNHGWERCRCGADIATRDRHVTIGDFARHVAEVTEAAVRETIAADIDRARDALDPDDYSGGPAYLSGIRYGLTNAAPIAKGES